MQIASYFQDGFTITTPPNNISSNYLNRSDWRGMELIRVSSYCWNGKLECLHLYTFPSSPVPHFKTVLTYLCPEPFLTAIRPSFLRAWAAQQLVLPASQAFYTNGVPCPTAWLCPFVSCLLLNTETVSYAGSRPFYATSAAPHSAHSKLVVWPSHQRTVSCFLYPLGTELQGWQAILFVYRDCSTLGEWPEEVFSRSRAFLHAGT